MKFPHSIRWRLQLWYGVLLALLLGGFGVTAYQLESARQLRRIDEELQQRLPVLVKSQRPSRANREIREFSLSPRDAALFDPQGDGAFYYVVWLRHGEPVTRSASAPRDVPEPPPGTPPNRKRGDLRETFLFPGPGDCVLVGRSVSRDLADLRLLAWWLGGVGAAVLLLGLAGGAWLVGRALRPIAEITSAAGKIAGGDLTRRIDTADTGSELGQLAEVLNTTFSRLDAAFTRQARFTADAAHELRTPLAVMLIHLQTGLTSEGLTDEPREAFEASQRAAQRMRRLTESLLALARLDSDTAIHALCDLAPLVRGAVELLRPLALQQEITLEMELRPASGSGNAEQLGQIVTNLVSNAISYNRAGGTVHVKTASEPGTAILTVSDTGQGISPDDLPHIFERFYRADSVRSGSAGRSGLGLAITRAIVEAHGGTLTVTSEPGQGSVFTVRLPGGGEM